MIKKIISTDAAPAAIGPYSQGISFLNHVYVSGQLPVNPSTGEIQGMDIIAQTEQCLKNLSAVIEESGLSLSNVLKTTVFLQSMDDFEDMNHVYAGFFDNKPPARSTVEVSRLPKGALVEIEAVAMTIMPAYAL